jgi:hypothetical protein
MVRPWKVLVKVLALLCPLLVWAVPAASSEEAVYQKHCAARHEQINDRIPAREVLHKMPSARILRALDAGAMMAIAFTISGEDRMAVASINSGYPRDGDVPGNVQRAFGPE